MRLLVCGGRAFQDRLAVFSEIDLLLADLENEYHMPKDGSVVIHGGCRTGADRWADEWAMVNWCPMVEFEADWKTHGKAAGPIRNQQMIDEGKPDLVLAFPGGRGTADMVRRAEAAGIPVRKIGWR